MSLDYEFIRLAIDIAMMILFVSVAFHSFLTKKYEGKRDKVRFLLVLTFTVFLIINIDKMFRYSQGIAQSADFEFALKSWAQIFMFLMVFEVLNIRYFYYSIPVLVIYVQIYYPSCWQRQGLLLFVRPSRCETLKWFLSGDHAPYR